MALIVTRARIAFGERPIRLSVRGLARGVRDVRGVRGVWVRGTRGARGACGARGVCGVRGIRRVREHTVYGATLRDQEGVAQPGKVDRLGAAARRAVWMWPEEPPIHVDVPDQAIRGLDERGQHERVIMEGRGRVTAQVAGVDEREGRRVPAAGAWRRAAHAWCACVGG
eukprot:6213425-Prymnesium_polylepis.2